MLKELKPISKLRFDALAGYCRRPETSLHSDEVDWYQTHEEKILIVIIRDHTDRDFSALLLSQDLKERYRFVRMTGFYNTEKETLENVSPVIEHVIAAFDEERNQGDERGDPVDFFAPVVAVERLNPDFKTISSLSGYSPALEIIKPMMRWYEDPDGNFIEQFQITGFNTRLWELYLFAMLSEVPFAIVREHPVPDFSAEGPFGELFIEATSVNPSGAAHLAPPPMETDAQRTDFLRNYMPIRFAGPLVKKLNHRHQNLRYWEQPAVQGKPLLFAIQDFHSAGSMAYSYPALPIYLYGMFWTEEQNAVGEVIGSPEVVDKHVWGEKEIESGFFYLPDSENISAVIINPSATISKFNRMGLMAEFGKPGVRILRQGFAATPSNYMAEPTRFSLEVGSPEYSETWIEGMSVYHNPNAVVPLNPELLPGAAHHFLNADGTLTTVLPDWHPISSETQIFTGE